MDRVVDEIIIFALCVPLACGAYGGGYSAIVALLVSVIVACASMLVRNARARNALLGAYLALSLASLEMTALVPVVAYQCVAQRARAMRAAWAAPLVVGGLHFGWHEIPAIALLCAIASVLSVRTMRNAAERKVMRSVRDGMRERLIDAERTASERDAADGRHDGAAPSAFSDVAENRDKIEGLTVREQTIAALIAEGLDNKEIASELYLSEGTVRNHISSILQKCQLKNRTQIAITYLSAQL